MILWGKGMGAQESIMRAVVGNMVSSVRHSYAYDVFNTAYGIFWFLGSLLIGILYDISIPALVIFSVTMQMASIPLFFLLRKHIE
jgi:predicted MFS family arabinose efflux permease